jgi:hypothetical protein
MTKPTLLVLAAGMGSRYGGLKQMDGLGPSGEVLLEYSIFDAFKAGFGKVVFIIRKEIEKAFFHLIKFYYLFARNRIIRFYNFIICISIHFNILFYFIIIMYSKCLQKHAKMFLGKDGPNKNLLRINAH